MSCGAASERSTLLCQLFPINRIKIASVIETRSRRGVDRVTYAATQLKLGSDTQIESVLPVRDGGDVKDGIRLEKKS